MFYLIDELEDEIQVTTHHSLESISKGIDWQDIYEGKTKIVDETGMMYKWDSSKEDEIGTVFGYSLISINQKYRDFQELILMLLVCHMS